MRTLLLEPKTEGYPPDFLLARLRGRRAVVDVASGRQRELTDPWSALQTELCWLFKTMDRKLRCKFGLGFLYFELRRLLIALRRLSGRSREGLAQLAVQPLLKRELIRQLQGAQEVADAVRVLDAALAPAAGDTAQLETVLAEQGYRQMEAQLVDSFFLAAATETREPVLRAYFGDLIDLHNLLTLLKSRRWQLPESPTLLPGGTHPPEKWQALQRAGREPELHKAISQISGSSSVDPESIEHTLLSRIRHKLQRQARAEPEAFLLLDYIWSRYLHARNLGLQHWAGGQLAAWEKLG